MTSLILHQIQNRRKNKLFCFFPPLDIVSRTPLSDSFFCPPAAIHIVLNLLLVVMAHG